MDKIKLERWKSYDFIVTFVNNLGESKRKHFRGAVGNKPFVAEVDNEMFEYLAHYTSTFEEGELRIADEQENKQELLGEILDLEAYENNAKSKTEVIDLFKKSNNKKLETELNKITDRAVKQFVASVFEEIKADLVGSKIKIVENWLGVASEE